MNASRGACKLHEMKRRAAPGGAVQGSAPGFSCGGYPAMARVQQEPRSPMPAQTQPKPGIEAKMKPKPNYQAPLYKGSGKLQDQVALITGGDSGIGRAVAVLYA